MELNGTVAVITGGGTGIGAACGEAFARAGAAAVLVGYSRSVDEAEQTAQRLRELGAEGSAAVFMDVRDEAAVRAVAAAAVAEHGRVDVLVNNAGTTDATPWDDLEDITDAAWDEVLDVNLRGAFRCTRALAPALREAGGAVVNISSIAGHRAGGSSVVYGVSKAALLQLTRSLARVLAPQVRVYSVSPGAVATRWLTRVFDEAAVERASADTRRTPLGRLARPEHVAQVVVGLLGMDLVTGEDVIVDAGRSILY
ncbi:SDR family NAD(P)-dependent oxidoreductase [Pseudonocardia humida]|uniref:SDR family oxidoreductase n=1 Tax=Pseudonocardia humida TaxID=2800819 RepID=A0ABT1AC39_9PSEU|nr:SDR family oxidoreductase [Pseudonocardia humida]MCO1660631.1 SDR family oxidoreductase [Pseudonocardia humida]